MDSRDMVALESFSYPFGSRDLKPGDRFRAVSDLDAHALALTRRARPCGASDDEQQAGTAEAGPRRQYKRRDMTAQA